MKSSEGIKVSKQNMQTLHLKQLEQQAKMRVHNETSPSKPSSSGIWCRDSVQASAKHNTDTGGDTDDDIEVKTDNDSEDSGGFANITEKTDVACRTVSPSTCDARTRTVSRKRAFKHRRKLRQLKRRLERRLSKGRAGKYKPRISSRQTKEDGDSDSEWESASEQEITDSKETLPESVTVSEPQLKDDSMIIDGQLLIDDGKDNEELDITKQHIPNAYQLERTIAKGCAKNKLSTSNVKSILRALISNDLVKDMLKNMLKDKVDDSPTQDLCVVPDYEPKLTRSKIKEVLEKEKDPKLWPVSPIKLGQPAAAAGPSILDVEFAEEEDEEDAEYEPSKDLEDADSDDESFTSSQVSEIGSPFPFGSPSPRLPSTSGASTVLGLPSPGVQVRAHAPVLPWLGVAAPVSPGRSDDQTQGMQSPMGPPLAPPPSASSTRKRLHFQVSDGDKETEEEDGVARRTRSKLPLTTISLYDIEEAFVAPDITPDMYDTMCDDGDWQEFLKGLLQTEVTDTHNESMEMAEDDDPEFNYLAETDKQKNMKKVDDGENRYKGLRVSRKELNSLMDELEDLFDDDFSVIEQRTNAAPAATGTIAKKPTAVTTTSTSEPESPPVVHVSKKFDWNQSKQQKDTVSESSDDEMMMLDHQMLQLQQQMRQHIQLTTQMYVLAQGCEDLCHLADDCEAMVKELDQLGAISSAGANSVYNACNLQGAIEIIDRGIDWASHRQLHSEYRANAKTSVSQRRGQKRSAAWVPSFEKGICNHQKWLLDVQKDVMWRSPVFLHPSFLPKLGLVPQAILKHLTGKKAYFTQSEDILLVLGIEQFKDFPGQSCFELIHDYLMPCKSIGQLQQRFNRTTEPKTAKDSNVWKYKETNKVPETPQAVEDFSLDMMKAPCDQPQNLLPQWCKGCHRHDRASKRREEKEAKFNARMQERARKERAKRLKRYREQDETRRRADELKSTNQQRASNTKRKRTRSVEDSISDERTKRESKSLVSSDHACGPAAKRQKLTEGNAHGQESEQWDSECGNSSGRHGGTTPSCPPLSDTPCAIVTSMGVFVSAHLADPSLVDLSVLASQLSAVSDPVLTVTSAVSDLVLTVTSAVGDPMSTMTSAVSDPVSTVTSAVGDPVSTMTSAVSDPVSTVASAVGDPVSTMTSAVSDPVLTVASAVSDPVSTVVSAVSDFVSTVTSAVSDPVSTVTSQLSAVNSPVSTVTSQLSAVNSPVSTMMSQLSAVNNPVSTVTSQLCAVNNPVSTVTSQLSAVNNPVSTVMSQLSTVNNPVSTVTSQLSPVTNPVSTVTSQLCAVNSPVSTVTSQLSAVNSPVSTVTSQLSAVTNPVSTVMPLLSAVNSSVSTVTSQLSAVSDPIEQQETAMVTMSWSECSSSQDALCSVQPSSLGPGPSPSTRGPEQRAGTGNSQHILCGQQTVDSVVRSAGNSGQGCDSTNRAGAEMPATLTDQTPHCVERVNGSTEQLCQTESHLDNGTVFSGDCPIEIVNQSASEAESYHQTASGIVESDHHTASEAVESDHHTANEAESDHQTEAVESDHHTASDGESDHQTASEAVESDHQTASEAVESDHQTASEAESDHQTASETESDHQTEAVESDHQTEAVESDHQTASEAESDHQTSSETGSDHHTASETESDYQTVSEAESDHQTEAESDHQTEAESDHQTEAESDHQTETESDHQTEAESDHQTEAESDHQTASVAVETDHQTEAESDHQTASEAETDHQPASEAVESDHQTASETESDHQTVAVESDHQTSSETENDHHTASETESDHQTAGEIVERDYQTASEAESDHQTDAVESDHQTDAVESDHQTDAVESDHQTDAVESDHQTLAAESDHQTASEAVESDHQTATEGAVQADHSISKEDTGFSNQVLHGIKQTDVGNIDMMPNTDLPICVDSLLSSVTTPTTTGRDHACASTSSPLSPRLAQNTDAVHGDTQTEHSHHRPTMTSRDHACASTASPLSPRFLAQSTSPDAVCGDTQTEHSHHRPTMTSRDHACASTASPLSPRLAQSTAPDAVCEDTQTEHSHHGPTMTGRDHAFASTASPLSPRLAQNTVPDAVCEDTQTEHSHHRPTMTSRDHACASTAQSTVPDAVRGDTQTEHSPASHHRPTMTSRDHACANTASPLSPRLAQSTAPDAVCGDTQTEHSPASHHRHTTTSRDHACASTASPLSPRLAQSTSPDAVCGDTQTEHSHHGPTMTSRDHACASIASPLTTQSTAPDAVHGDTQTEHSPTSHHPSHRPCNSCKRDGLHSGHDCTPPCKTPPPERGQPNAPPDNPNIQLDFLQAVTKTILGSPAKVPVVCTLHSHRAGESSRCSSASSPAVSLQGAPSVVSSAAGVNITINMICPLSQSDCPIATDEAAESPSSTTGGEIQGEKVDQGKTSQRGESSGDQCRVSDDSVSSTSDIGEGSDRAKPLYDHVPHFAEMSDRGEGSSVNLITMGGAGPDTVPQCRQDLLSVSPTGLSEHVESVSPNSSQVLGAGHGCAEGGRDCDSSRELLRPSSACSPPGSVQAGAGAHFDYLPGEETIHLQLAGLESFVEVTSSQCQTAGASLGSQLRKTKQTETESTDGGVSRSERSGTCQGPSRETPPSVSATSVFLQHTNIDPQASNSETSSDKRRSSFSPSPQRQTTDIVEADALTVADSEELANEEGTPEPVPLVNAVSSGSLQTTNSVRDSAANTSTVYLAPLANVGNRTVCLASTSSSPFSFGADSDRATAESSKQRRRVRRRAHTSWSGLSSVCDSADFNIVVSVTLPASPHSIDSTASDMNTSVSSSPVENAASSAGQEKRSDSGAAEGNLSHSVSSPAVDSVRELGSKACGKSSSVVEEALSVNDGSRVSAEVHEETGLISGLTDSSSVGDEHVDENTLPGPSPSDSEALRVLSSPVAAECSTSSVPQTVRQCEAVSVSDAGPDSTPKTVPVLPASGAVKILSPTTAPRSTTPLAVSDSREGGECIDGSTTLPTTHSPTTCTTTHSPTTLPTIHSPTIHYSTTHSPTTLPTTHSPTTLPTTHSPTGEIQRGSFAGLLPGAVAVATSDSDGPATAHTLTAHSPLGSASLEPSRAAPVPLMSDDTMNALFDQIRDGGTQSSASVTFGSLSSSNMSQDLLLKHADVRPENKVTAHRPSDTPTSASPVSHGQTTGHCGNSTVLQGHISDCGNPTVLDGQTSDCGNPTVLHGQTSDCGNPTVLHKQTSDCGNPTVLHGQTSDCGNPTVLHGQTSDCGNPTVLHEQTRVLSNEWTRDQDKLILEMVRDCGESADTFAQIADKLQVTPEQVCERLSALLELLGSSEEETTNDTTDDENL